MFTRGRCISTSMRSSLQARDAVTLHCARVSPSDMSRRRFCVASSRCFLLRRVGNASGSHGVKWNCDAHSVDCVVVPQLWLFVPRVRRFLGDSAMWKRSQTAVRTVKMGGNCGSPVNEFGGWRFEFQVFGRRCRNRNDLGKSKKKWDLKQFPSY